MMATAPTWADLALTIVAAAVLGDVVKAVAVRACVAAVMVVPPYLIDLVLYGLGVVS